MLYKVVYEPKWSKLSKGLTTEVEAESREKAKEWFTKFFPAAKIKSIRKII